MKTENIAAIASMLSLALGVFTLFFPTPILKLAVMTQVIDPIPPECQTVDGICVEGIGCGWKPSSQLGCTYSYAPLGEKDYTCYYDYCQVLMAYTMYSGGEAGCLQDYKTWFDSYNDVSSANLYHMKRGRTVAVEGVLSNKWNRFMEVEYDCPEEVSPPPVKLPIQLGWPTIVAFSSFLISLAIWQKDRLRKWI